MTAGRLHRAEVCRPAACTPPLAEVCQAVPEGGTARLGPSARSAGHLRRACRSPRSAGRPHVRLGLARRRRPSPTYRKKSLAVYVRTREVCRPPVVCASLVTTGGLRHAPAPGGRRDLPTGRRRRRRRQPAVIPCMTAGRLRRACRPPRSADRPPAPSRGLPTGRLHPPPSPRSARPYRRGAQPDWGRPRGLPATCAEPVGRRGLPAVRMSGSAWPAGDGRRQRTEKKAWPSTSARARSADRRSSAQAW